MCSGYLLPRRALYWQSKMESIKTSAGYSFRWIHMSEENEYLQDGRRLPKWATMSLAVALIPIGICALHSFVLVAEGIASAADACRHSSKCQKIVIKPRFIFYIMRSVNACNPNKRLSYMKRWGKVLLKILIPGLLSWVNTLLQVCLQALARLLLHISRQLLSHYIHKYWPSCCLPWEKKNHQPKSKKYVLLTCNTFQVWV